MTENELITTAISSFALVASVFSVIYTRRSARISEATLRRASFERVQSFPSLEVIEVVLVEDKHRAKLIIFNQRDVPIRVHCIRLYVLKPKPFTLKNFIKSKTEPFDWNYEPVEQAIWNPKGHFGDEELYVRQAVEYSIVKDTEFFNVTIPEYQEGQEYKFEAVTSIGTVSSTSRPSPKSRTYFSSDYRSEIF